MKIHKSNRKMARVFSWVARSIGLLIISIFIFISIGNLFGKEDPYAIGEPNTSEMYPTLIVISFWILFFVIAWFNELIGSIGTIIWAIIWGFPIYFTSGNNAMGMFLILPSPFLLVGLLFLCAMYLEETHQKKKA
ncbi:MAG: DUF7670 domain-containing protein [Promethearchaeota archaeon]